MCLCTWAFAVNSNDRTVKTKTNKEKEASGAFVAITSSLTLKTTAVINALGWLKSQDYTPAGILSDSVNVLK